MTALLDAIRAHADRFPEATAIDGYRRLDWRALARLIPALAADLRSRFDPDRPIATQVDHGAGECLLDLALIEAGLIAIPLPPFFSDGQVDAALARSGAQALIAGPVDIVDDVAPRLVFSVTATDHPKVDLPSGTARITFTSGSTGEPKGVCLSLDHLLGVARAVADRLGADHAGRHLPLLPPGILLESVAGFLGSILGGGSYVPLPQADVGLGNPFAPDVAAMLRAIETQAITSLILVPEYLAGLVAGMRAGGTRLPRLTLVAVGGARTPPGLLDDAAAVGLPVRQGYGLTECASVVTLDDGDPAGRGSVGLSIGVNVVRLADDGEIVIDGPSFLGTIGQARAPGPYRTGDIGRIDEDGRLWIEGRKSALIVTSYGRNISPEWVEGALIAQPEIRQAMVRGDGRAELDALIVPASPTADIFDAVARANRTLPFYAQVHAWRVVPPFTPLNGQLTANARLRRAAVEAAYPFAALAPSAPFFDRLVAATREAQARFAAVPQLQAGLAGRISRRDYLAYLAQAYHHVRHTVPLMQAARAGLSDKPMLVAALDDYIAEETGHEYWILDDIDAAGGDSRAVAASMPSPATQAMVAHAYRTIREGNPASFFGMVYVLEGTSILLARHGASAVQRALGLPDDAFRYLTSHGALDQDHMRFFEGLMNRIDDARDQQAIIEMANAMFVLFGGVFGSIDLEVVRVAA